MTPSAAADRSRRPDETTQRRPINKKRPAPHYPTAQRLTLPPPSAAGRLVGLAIVHATRDAGRIHEMVERAVRWWGFRGMKVHGHDALPTREVCDTARALGLPLFVDVIGRAHVVDLLASQYPDVNFVVLHFGSFGDNWRAHERVVEQLARYPNVHADTSGVRRFDYIVEGVRRVGAHKLLFGSDGPWLHPGVELHKIRLLRLPPREQSLILGGNALRLLRAMNRATRRSQLHRQ